MGDLMETPTPSPALAASQSRPLPVREDCWSEDATSTLVDAWGRRYMELNRGNLRQKDWQDVADAVNALHGHTKKTHRTDVQCKNRIDTIKKKYKIEKARVPSSDGTPTSSWPFFERLDALIGSSVSAKKPPPPTTQISRSMSPSPPVAVPLYSKKTPPSVTYTAVVLPQKRPSPATDDGYFRRNYSAMAAAAAAAEDADDVEEEEDEEEEEEPEEERDRSEVEEREGLRRLARAIERFGEVYERVERDKLRQMVELEKQRMQFAKDLEVQRMNMFMDTQVQLERIKHDKRSRSNDIYS